MERPKTEHTQGSLLFGEKAISASPLLKFTRILNPPSGLWLESTKYYFVELIGISVAKKRLNVSSSLFASPGTIIDSGPVVTRLPTAAYKALRTAFQQEMLHCPSIPPPPPEKLLDTCYNLKGCGGRNITLPEIALHFVGEVDVSLHPSGILWVYEGRTQACLAFTGKSHPSHVAIIGNR
ncbi:aspartyl protease family protein At5g10770-like [Vitis riparia]|uniref:aspartyl protease family protein At5g10770-like n=1 Tax=Vitis riparia TaxID=96939 RepID=UPI00155B15F6|nr:aspartyl protease family protein At5g10770-like [Vitis riparia]